MRGDALQVDDEGCGSPVTAKASIVVEPCSNNDLKWSCAVAAIRRMARAAAKQHHLRVQSHVMLVPNNDPQSFIRFFCCKNMMRVHTCLSSCSLSLKDY